MKLKGSFVEDDRVKVTINDERTANTIGQFYTAKEGWKYYIIDITIQNIGKKEISYSPSYVQAKDSDGYVFSGDIASARRHFRSSFTIISTFT